MKSLCTSTALNNTGVINIHHKSITHNQFFIILVQFLNITIDIMGTITFSLTTLEYNICNIVLVGKILCYFDWAYFKKTLGEEWALLLVYKLWCLSFMLSCNCFTVKWNERTAFLFNKCSLFFRMSWVERELLALVNCKLTSFAKVFYRAPLEMCKNGDRVFWDLLL